MSWDWWYLGWWVSGFGAGALFLYYWLARPMARLLGFEDDPDSPALSEGEGENA